MMRGQGVRGQARGARWWVSREGGARGGGQGGQVDAVVVCDGDGCDGSL